MKFVKSSLLVKLVILVLVVYATVTLVSQYKQLRTLDETQAALTGSITALEQEIDRTRDDILALDTDAGTESAARDRLDMARDGDIVFHDTGK